ncbi:hypothetical protein CKM354_000761300 [Cercospora kikuchii]|uniref:Uncharacterized protein n=1 Tax=Cercospora kikuchii TaxID=84275 RepID=A0A9P3FJ80_9PEZI|nr:uncharacterized protein CKM354_000761300 [Cercospora kikuchii]GIZ44415.1 hypothetical protein CKM354_000761300 [Cercospora kikuchii]
MSSKGSAHDEKRELNNNDNETNAQVPEQRPLGQETLPDREVSPPRTKVEPREEAPSPEGARYKDATRSRNDSESSGEVDWTDAAEFLDETAPEDGAALQVDPTSRDGSEGTDRISHHLRPGTHWFKTPVSLREQLESLVKDHDDRVRAKHLEEMRVNVQNIARDLREDNLERLRALQTSSMAKFVRKTDMDQLAVRMSTEIMGELKGELKGVYIANARQYARPFLEGLFDQASSNWDDTCRQVQAYVGNIRSLVEQNRHVVEENRRLLEENRRLLEENRQLREGSQDATAAYAKADELENFVRNESLPGIVSQFQQLWQQVDALVSRSNGGAEAVEPPHVEQQTQPPNGHGGRGRGRGGGVDNGGRGNRGGRGGGRAALTAARGRPGRGDRGGRQSGRGRGQPS